MKLVTQVLFAAAIMFAPMGSAQGDIVVVVAESGSDLIVTATGSVDLNGLVNVGSASGGISGSLEFGPNWWGTYDPTLSAAWRGGIATVTDGWPEMSIEAAGSGNILVQPFSAGDTLWLPFDYVSGTSIIPLYEGLTLANASFDSLGLTEGLRATYTWDSGASGEQSVVFRTSAIPEPSSIALLAFFAGLVVTRRRVHN